MSTATQVRGLSVDLANYLETTYRPDCEYVDGELRERNVGKFEHARLQSLLAGWLINHEGEWGIISCTPGRHTAWAAAGGAGRSAVAGDRDTLARR